MFGSNFTEGMETPLSPQCDNEIKSPGLIRLNFRVSEYKLCPAIGNTGQGAPRASLCEGECLMDYVICQSDYKFFCLVTSKQYVESNPIGYL